MNKREQRKSAYKRFRLDPPTVELRPDGSERQMDLVWIEIMKDETGRYLAAVGDRYVLRLNFDHIRETVSNPTPGSRTGHDAEATFLLKTQVVFTAQVPSGIIHRPLRHDSITRRRVRRADQAVVIPLSGTANKTSEAAWIGILGIAVLALIGRLKI